MSCGVGCRHGSDLVAVAVAVAGTAVRRPAWQLPYAVGAVLKKKKKKERKKKEKKYKI